MYYADDNQVFVSFKPNHPSMYNDAEHIFSWNSNTGVLKSNPEEAEVVQFYITVSETTIFWWKYYVCRN